MRGDDRRIYVGDTVETPEGTGVVASVTTWRDRIVSMSDEEAVEFSAICRRTVGLEYREKWMEIKVDLSAGRALFLQRNRVKILEGRDNEKKRLEGPFS